jgi:charged multivesicular body protein 4
MMTVEREIGSIESANINKETLDAMSNASKAMKGIHGDLTVDKVDQVMEDLRDQHAVGEEIAEALTAGAGANGVDEDELDEELAELQQEALDERMLKTGSVPVHDQIQRMPSAPSKFLAVGGRNVQSANTFLQQRTLPRQKKTTRRPSYGSCRPRWPCEVAAAA